MSKVAAASAGQRQKELGAFYTPPLMAAALSNWALRSEGDIALDPSFGGFVFMESARARLAELGASREAVARQIFGVDLDEEAHLEARARSWLGLSPDNFLHRDFFSVGPEELPQVDALVGNPPYIRYQAFNGSSDLARELALKAGVRLTRLASSWAPFVVHATSFVAPNGRLAQVLPAELLHAQYAEEVLDFLKREFRRVFIVTFEKRVFPGALEEVVLLCADGRGAPGVAGVQVLSCGTVEDVPDCLGDAESAPAPVEDDNGPGLIGQLLPSGSRSLYARLAADTRVKRLGDMASVDIGIVTGANDFFVLRKVEAEALPKHLLRPAVAKAFQVAGAHLSSSDHRALLRDGQRGLMLVGGKGGTTRSGGKNLDSYIAQGESLGLHERYKCRIREPWWALPVPAEGPADLLLTYCSNNYPRLAVNEARVLSTNTIHGVRVKENVDPRVLGAGFYNSLTLLSAELEGRSYGGGVLKLEPTDAETLLMPPLSPELAELLPSVDKAIRMRDLEAANELIDPIVLGALGLTGDEIQELRAARRRLLIRRKNRSRPPD